MDFRLQFPHSFDPHDPCGNAESIPSYPFAFHQKTNILRASPTVWQILFPKSRCLPTPKIIWGGKKDLISNSLTNFVFKNPLTKRKDPLSERRAPLSEQRTPLSTRKLRCAASAARAYMRAIDRDLPTCQRCQTQIPNY
jgi:hypothetical protein